jgi:hypothetical protein
MTRALVLFLGIVFLSLGSRLVVQAQSSNWPSLFLIQQFSGLHSPLFLTHAGDQSQRIFVVEQEGLIKLIKNGTIQSKAFLDIKTRVQCCGEEGLFSMAFPPQYATKGHFYVYYINKSGDIVIARFKRKANTADEADPSSEEILLTIPHPGESNHNGGQIAFSPTDGFLYIATGDGGGSNDQHENGQNTLSLLGKILRIDVESDPGNEKYLVPLSNPFVGVTGYREEIWAVGTRNPWRVSFDRQAGDFYIGDVGQGGYEEIDFQPASSTGGENYGWNTMEGEHCFVEANCDQTGLTLPIHEYDHSDGCSVTGGYVHRGSAATSLNGIYFYADFCSGKIWGLRRDGSNWENHEFLDTNLHISSFGEDEAGNLFALDINGAIYLVTDTPPCAKLTASSVPRAVTFKPTASRAARKTIRVTLNNRTGAPVRVENIAVPSLEFLIIADGIRPRLPLDIPNGRRRTISVRLERSIGLPPLTVNNPYFQITTDMNGCAPVNTASELVGRWPIEAIQKFDELTKQREIYLKQNSAIVRTQIFDLSGHAVLDTLSEALMTPPEALKGKRLAPGVYLYMTTLQSWDGKIYRNSVSKFIVP